VIRVEASSAFGSLTADGLVTGSGDEFTVWVAADIEVDDACVATEVNVMTGSLLPDGRLLLRFGAVLVGIRECGPVLPGAFLGAAIVIDGTGNPVGPPCETGLPRYGSGPETFRSPADFLAHPGVAGMIARSNLAIHRGGTPPAIDGGFEHAPIVDLSDPDPSLTDTAADTSVLCLSTGPVVSIREAGSLVEGWVTGDGDRFTAFFLVAAARSSCTTWTAVVCSGTVLANGDLDLTVGRVPVGHEGLGCEQRFAPARPEDTLNLATVLRGTAMRIGAFDTCR